MEDFDEFYTSTAPSLLRQVFHLTGDLSEAEDVVHEAYERAWLHWASVRRADSPEAWVRTVARRLAVSRWRRARNAALAWQRRDQQDQWHAPDGQHVDIVDALRRLPEKQRVAIVLHHLADLSVEQVAAETGATASAVKQQLVRGRAALAALLHDDDLALTSTGGETT